MNFLYLYAEGARGEPIRTTREKAWHSVYSVVETVKLRQMGSFLGWCSLISGASIGDFYPALVALVSPVQNIFFLTVQCFKLCVPIAQQPGQEVVQGRLSLHVSPWTHLRHVFCLKKNRRIRVPCNLRYPELCLTMHIRTKGLPHHH